MLGRCVLKQKYHALSVIYSAGFCAVVIGNDSCCLMLWVLDESARHRNADWDVSQGTFKKDVKDIPDRLCLLINEKWRRSIHSMASVASSMRCTYPRNSRWVHRRQYFPESLRKARKYSVLRRKVESYCNVFHPCISERNTCWQQQDSILLILSWKREAVLFCLFSTLFLDFVANTACCALQCRSVLGLNRTTVHYMQLHFCLISKR